MDLLRLLHGKKPRTIGVDGNSGSGKSTAARRLAEALDGEVIPCDFFHKHERKDWRRLRDMEDFEDLGKLQSVLRRLQEGETVELHDLYEFVTGTHIGSHRFHPKPVLIVEGLCVMRLPLDFKIFVETDPQLAYERARQRDLAERGLTEEDWAVKERLFHGVYHSLVPELKAKADIVIRPMEDAGWL
jgi:uridine kinase